MNSFKNIGIILFCSIAMMSCKSGRNAQDGDRNNIPSRKTDDIIQRMHSNEIDCEWLSIKYDVEIKTSKIDDSFKLYARVKKDSAIWISATYYSVEVARFLFTPDSVKFMDRKNNQFYVGTYDYITDRFMIHADFVTLQSLILGNGSALLNTEEKVRSSKDKNAYHLSFLRDGQMRRALRKEDDKAPLSLNVSLLINAESFRMNECKILDFTEGRSLTAKYSDFQKQCNSTLPYTINYVAASPNEQANVKTSVIKLSANKKVSLSFTIPEKYEAITP